LVVAAAVAEGLLCFLAAEVVVGGREVDLRLGEDQPFLAQEERSSSLPPGGGGVVEQV